MGERLAVIKSNSPPIELGNLCAEEWRDSDTGQKEARRRESGAGERGPPRGRCADVDISTGVV